MTEILIRRRIERHEQAAQQAKGEDYNTYWRERRKMLLAQADLHAARRGRRDKGNE